MSEIKLFFDSLQYDFMIYAMIVGPLVALSSSFLGTFLVLKKFSMIGDGLAHVSFASVALALLLGQSPLIVSLIVVVLASFFILFLNEKADLHGDAAIGLISSSSIAIGALIAKISGGFNVDLFSYLFGSILAIEKTDVILSIIITSIVAFSIFFFYNTLFSITYDEEFAQVNGVNTRFINYFISILTSITIVLGIRIVGTMLISSMIIFPTVSALQVARGFKQTIMVSCIISIIAVFFGIFFSFIFDLPTGATIVVMNTIIFLLMYLVKVIKS